MHKDHSSTYPSFLNGIVAVSFCIAETSLQHDRSYSKDLAQSPTEPSRRTTDFAFQNTLRTPRLIGTPLKGKLPFTMP
ncbi:hypothetical protein DF947_11030 [Pedobacter paludis]|uniref:Uncharacterized protein n=1 Tax=Pedobacter paludis TaxID=2203212 RepID=A0A317EZF6_9SPHI|nr:hypothetical protein DF947_11030 [Pedobacter paludis]